MLGSPHQRRCPVREPTNEHGTLSEQVDAYVAWKRELVREITRYRSWLAHNRLSSEGVEAVSYTHLTLPTTPYV